MTPAPVWEHYMSGRVILELTHYNGARHCRRRGLANADFQAKMCATAYNLKLWMRKLSGGQLMAA